MALIDYLNNKPTIKTERLTLRMMNKNDIASLKEWMPDKEIYKYWGKNPGKTDKNPELMFKKEEVPTKSFHLGIELNQIHKIIGEIWIYLIENDRMAKIAIRLGRQHHGKGYASEAVEAMVRFCFEKTELQRIWTDVDVNNIASIKVLEKCSFKREGTIRQGKMVSTWCDYHLYGILKEDIEKRNAMKNIEQIIRETTEENQDKTDWTKAWSTKYPILKQYQGEVDIPRYAKKIRELFNELQNDYGYNELDAMLVLKDILAHEYTDNKKKNKI